MGNFVPAASDDVLNRRIVRRVKGIGLAVNLAAKEIAAKAEVLKAEHVDKGHSYITVTRGRHKVDSFVNLNDERGDQAAWAMEMGYVDKRFDEETESYVLREVPGQAILRRATEIF